MSVVMFKVVALVFERIERFVLDFPAASAYEHDVLHVFVVQLQIGHPAKASGFAVFVGLLVVQHVYSHIGITAIEGQVIEVLELELDALFGTGKAFDPLIMLKSFEQSFIAMRLNA